MPKKNSAVKKKKRRIKRKKLKFKKRDKIFISTLLFIGLILSVFIYVKMVKNGISKITKETNLTQTQNETKPSQGNVSRVPEKVIIIGKGSKIKIVG